MVAEFHLARGLGSKDRASQIAGAARAWLNDQEEDLAARDGGTWLGSFRNWRRHYDRILGAR